METTHNSTRTSTTRPPTPGTTARTTPPTRSARRRRVAATVAAVLTLTGILGSTFAVTGTAHAVPAVRSVDVDAPWANLGLRPGGGAEVVQVTDDRLVIAGPVELTVAGQVIVLPEGGVVLERDAAGDWQVASGFARLALPSIGLLDGGQLADAPFVRFGRARGDRLAHLGAHLRDTATYWHFQFEGALGVPLAGADTPALAWLTDALPSGDGTGVVVLEEHGTYGYIGGRCPNLPGRMVGRLASRARSSAVSTARRQRQLAAAAARTDEQRARAQRLIELGDRVKRVQGQVRDVAAVLGDAAEQVELPLAAEPADVEGAECGIGVSADGSIPGVDLDGAPFGGDVVVDGRMEVNPFVAIDGTAMLGLLPAGVVVMATGDVAATVPMTDLSVDLGTADVQIRVDERGGRLTGRGQLQVPGVDVRGTARVDLFVGGTELRDSYLRADADLAVGGVALAAAHIDADRNGLTVAGRARLGGVTVDLEGTANARGADLRGAVEVTLPSLAQELSKSTTAAIRTTEVDLARLPGRIDQARHTVREERRRTSQDLQRLQQTIVTERSRLSGIDDAIAADQGRIAAVQAAIRAEEARFRSLDPFRKLAQVGTHVWTLTRLRAQLAGLELGVTVQRGYQTAARAALTLAERGVGEVERAIAAADVDSDLRVAVLLSEQRAGNARLAELRRQANAASQHQLKGTLRAAVGTSGIGGSIQLRQCEPSGRCTPVAAARLVLAPKPMACAALTPLPEVCIAL